MIELDVTGVDRATPIMNNVGRGLTTLNKQFVDAAKGAGTFQSVLIKSLSRSGFSPTAMLAGVGLGSAGSAGGGPGFLSTFASDLTRFGGAEGGARLGDFAGRMAGAGIGRFIGKSAGTILGSLLGPLGSVAGAVGGAYIGDVIGNKLFNSERSEINQAIYNGPNISRMLGLTTTFAFGRGMENNWSKSAQEIEVELIKSGVTMSPETRGDLHEMIDTGRISDDLLIKLNKIQKDLIKMSERKIKQQAASVPEY